MNGNSNARCDRLNGVAHAAAWVALLAISSASYSAEEGYSRPPESISVTVSLADLDLATAAGKAVAHARVAAAARKACRVFRDSSSLADRETFAECWKDAQNQALQKLDGRADAGGENPGTPDSAARHE